MPDKQNPRFDHGDRLGDFELSGASGDTDIANAAYNLGREEALREVDEAAAGLLKQDEDRGSPDPQFGVAFAVDGHEESIDTSRYSINLSTVIGRQGVLGATFTEALFAANQKDGESDGCRHNPVCPKCAEHQMEKRLICPGCELTRPDADLIGTGEATWQPIHWTPLPAPPTPDPTGSGANTINNPQGDYGKAYVGSQGRLASAVVERFEVGESVESLADDFSLSMDTVCLILAAHDEATPDPALPVEGSRECHCDDCDRDYEVWFAPNELWNAVMRPNGEVGGEPFLCASCFAIRAVAVAVGVAMNEIAPPPTPRRRGE